ncbi:MAG: hypothetical protein K1X57_05820 [Gemmataceae bacterium]|nr:hypothetical protein [Gemmataceae bacterium]
MMEYADRVDSANKCRSSPNPQDTEQRIMSVQPRLGFWRESFAIEGSVLPVVLTQVLIFGLIALAICLLTWFVESCYSTRLGLEVTPHELSGAALGLLLVFRTNSGYDRWWEARKLWGGFVDRTRNFVIGALAYGPRDPDWQREVVLWTAAYPYVAKHALRREKLGPNVTALLGVQNAQRVGQAEHMPAYVARHLADLLRVACEQHGMDRRAFQQVDRERALLIDNFGGCERILNTPLPRSYSIKIRQFIILFLLTLPLALLHRLSNDWLVPLITMFVAYPLLALDQLGVELENPFSTDNLSHLPLEGIANTIEGNVLGLLASESARAKSTSLPNTTE